MKKTRMTKLVLNRETLHALENTSLQAVVGGVTIVEVTHAGSCQSYPDTCPPCTSGTTGSATCPPPPPTSLC